MSTDYNWHGLLLASRNLPPPTCVFQTQEAARKDTGTGVDGSEYLDSPEVLDIKADIFIDLCKKSKAPAILSGAGLSTASGIRDYASNNRGTAQQKDNRLTYEFIYSCRPTVAHRVFAAMGRAGLIKPSPYNWVQQNHDGLELRAGWPEMSNLIHGQWLDTWEIAMKDNQVVPMSGNLRSDLFEHLLNLEKKMDFCISVGTSHSGLNVDRLVKTSGTRFAKQKTGLGMAMLTIQKTPYDHLAALRIFCKCDDFMMIVAKKLNLTIDLDTDYDSVKRTPIKYPATKRTEKMLRFCRDPQFAKHILNASAEGGAPSAANSTSADTNGKSPVEATMKKSASSAAASSSAINKETKITFGNHHEEIDDVAGNGHAWSMFVGSSKDNIKSVTYSLHPTFSPQKVTVTREESKTFRLRRQGWGTFEVGVDVTLTSGQNLQLKHELSFQGSGSAQSVTLPN